MSQNITRQITVAEMAPHIHTFASGENKVNKISKWLIEWIKASLKKGTIKPYDLLPSKSDLAFHIGVSIGTIQNVFRYVEDCGLIESKQRIGTYIKDKNNSQVFDKLTSKRELAIEKIKKYIIENKYRSGDTLISTRKLGQVIGISNTTVRMALGSMLSENIIKKDNNSFIINKTDFTIENIEVHTLAEKTASLIKKEIICNLTKGKKIPANAVLAKQFNTSIKTIHDAIKILVKEGLLYTRRGKYGTVVANDKSENLPYCYEQIEHKIRQFILNSCNINTKLPPITELAKEFKVSSKTIKKALDNLAEDGYVAFIRGRYGGTYVTDIPQDSSEAYQWLALSPSYTRNIEN